MNDVEYHTLLVGLLMSDGLNESSRESSQALERADMLENIGTAIAYTGALRIRAIYYARRGDVVRADQYYNELGLQAIQGGTVWQGEWFSVPSEGAAGAAWNDLVVLRRSLDRLRLLVAEAPSLGNLYDGMCITYHFRRGEYARAAELGARYVESHPPRTVTGWSSCYGVVALSYVEIGEAERARALCEYALAQVSSEDLSYFVLYTTLEVAHATALAMTGEPERGKSLMRQKIERIRRHGEHSSLVIVYQYQARMAQLLGDRELLAESLQAMREAALMSGLPAVILLATRVAELRAGNRSSPLPPPSAPLDSVLPQPNKRDTQARTSSLTEVTAVAAFLRRAPSGRRRIRDALWLLARYWCCDEAYVFRLEAPSELTLLASIPDERQAPALTRALSAALQPLAQAVTLDNGARYRLLTIKAPDNDQPLGLVAIREGAETVSTIPADLLQELSEILAQDIHSTASDSLPSS
jgi:hypothetical protein